jgi:hypothetical protein
MAMSMHEQSALPRNATNGVIAAQRDFTPGHGKIRGTAGTWILTILACLYIAGTGIVLYYSTGRFNDLYNSLNVAEFTGRAWFVFHCYRWFYPSFFGSALALLITKEFFIRRTWMNVAITIAVSIAIWISGEVMAFTLYDPIKLFQVGPH